MRINDIITEDIVSELQPDSVVTVFHASSDVNTIKSFLINGIDGTQRIPRKYPHYITNTEGKRELINRGLFVTRDLKTALNFGNYAIKFKTLAKNLYSPFPDKRSVADYREIYSKDYPKSFRPEVSAYLSGKAWGNEPQALFRGTTSPRAIEAIYAAGDIIGEWTKISKEEFLEKHAAGSTHVSKNLAEPQEFKTATIEDLFNRRLGKALRISREELESITAKELSRMDSFEAQIDTFRNLFKIPYSVAKRLIMPMLKHLNVEKKPTVGHKEIYHGF